MQDRSAGNSPDDGCDDADQSGQFEHYDHTHPEAGGHGHQQPWSDASEPFNGPEIEHGPGFIDSKRTADIEADTIARFQLSKDSADFLGAELLDIIRDQLPEGVVLDAPRLLGANSEGSGITTELTVGVSFTLKDDGFDNEGRHYLPDPSAFEPHHDSDQLNGESHDGSSPEVIYEIEDADPDNPHAPRRVRQRAPKSAGSGKHLATLATMSGDCEEVFEPVETHARVVLVSYGQQVEVNVVFGDAGAVPTSVLDRLVDTSPHENLELPDSTSQADNETAEQIFLRLRGEGLEPFDIVPQLQAAGFSEDDIIPLLSLKSEETAAYSDSSTNQQPSYSTDDFPIEEVQHPFSFGRVELEAWIQEYSHDPETPYLGTYPTIRGIERVVPETSTLRVTLEMPTADFGTEIHRLTLEPTLTAGKIGFRIKDCEVLDFGEYISQRRIELGLEPEQLPHSDH